MEITQTSAASDVMPEDVMGINVIGNQATAKGDDALAIGDEASASRPRRP